MQARMSAPTSSAPENISARIRELTELYGAPDACVATLLCDRHDPRKVAYRIIDRSLVGRDFTYEALRVESERFAAVLVAQGVRSGDRVATLMGKSREYLTVLMGIWRLGAVHVPLFTAFAPPAIAFRLAGSGAKIVICDEAQRDKLRAGEDIPADASWRVMTTGRGDEGALEFDALMAAAKPGSKPAALGGDAPLIHIYTSGTTGKPKGVVVPIRALAAFQVYAEFALGLRADDVYWCGADPGWAYGLYFGILSSFTTGVRSVLFEGAFTPESTFSVLAQESVTNFAAAPTVYRAMRTSGIAPSNIKLRCASSAGEPLTPEVNEWSIAAFGVAVHDHYGQTEMGMLINNHHHPALHRPLKAGSMGQSMPGWTAVVLREQSDELASPMEVGRVALDMTASPLAFFEGYYNDPAKSREKFAGNGRWYLTGDTGFVDADGYFHFSSRDDDVIIMAGYRIGPFEVESAMAMHPAVAESAVIAVPDEIRGEVIEAYVVLRKPEEASADLAGAIQRWVKTRYAAHAYPRAVHFVRTLPKTPSGKIQRFVLRHQRRAELAAARSGAAV
jgi:acetyl-CoA synthetase